MHIYVTIIPSNQYCSTAMVVVISVLPDHSHGLVGIIQTWASNLIMNLASSPYGMRKQLHNQTNTSNSDKKLSANEIHGLLQILTWPNWKAHELIFFWYWLLLPLSFPPPPFFLFKNQMFHVCSHIFNVVTRHFTDNLPWLKKKKCSHIFRVKYMSP